MSEQPDVREVKSIYIEACRLIEGLLAFEIQASMLDELSRQRLDRAILLLSTVIHFNPTHWPSLWLLGKVALRLGDHSQSFYYFRLASNCNPDHPDVLRETTIAALEVGRLEDAMIYGLRAVEVAPNDAGLRANLALALLFLEKLDEAKATVNLAICLDPSDSMTKRLGGIINEVLCGVRPCPHHVRDLK